MRTWKREVVSTVFIFIIIMAQLTTAPRKLHDIVCQKYKCLVGVSAPRLLATTYQEILVVPDT